MTSLRSAITVAALIISAANAHYANMTLDGVSCYIYDGIAGTPDDHMIVRNNYGTWYDHDDPAKHGDITVVHSQADYDTLPTKPKIGIVCPR